LEWPTGPDDATPPDPDIKNDYGVQIIGYFHPPTTGTYRFAIAADDNAEMYLSTDSTPANKVLIGVEAGWNTVRNWDGQANGRVLVDVGTPDERWNNQSKGIALTQGQVYYIEALMKEGGGGDNLAVAYKTDGTWPVLGDLPILGSELSTIDKTMGPVSITTQPANQDIQEGTRLTLTVGVDGTPPFTFQWKKAGVDILDATNATFSIAITSASDAGQYTVLVTGGQGSPVTSNPATVTVQSDTQAPTIVQVSGSGDFTHVTVIYSERVEEATGTNAANYAIAGPGGAIAVTSGRLLNDTTVLLTTALQTTATSYTLTVNNVRDRAFNPNTIAANTQVPFTSAVFRNGLANWERWQDVDGDTGNIDTFVQNLADPAFRGPDVTGVLGFLGTPRDTADNYGARAFCVFVAPTTANYVFFMQSDDQGYLYLSTDSNPANKKIIAAQPVWGALNQWLDPELDRTMGLAENSSDQYTASQWPTPNVISLTAGTQYYIELVFREGTGGDGGEVYYKLSTDADPANGAAPNLTGNVIGSNVDPAVLPPVITSQPGNIAYTNGQTLTFAVVVESSSPVTYQWAKNSIPIPNATANPFVIANADHTAIGDYSVTVSNKNGTVSTLSSENNTRALLVGGFLIEAEDFNYNGGQTTNVASVMPYLGGAYAGLRSVLDVDFFHDGDNSGGAAFAYNRMDPADTGVIEIKGPNDPNDRFRGDFTITANYALGWTAATEWQNYTRTFPAGNYVVYAGAAHDGRAANEINLILSKVANPTVIDGSSIGVEGKQQGLTKLGTFLGPGTGGWSSNDLFPLRDGDGTGPITQVALGGTETLRLTFNATDGDADFFLFYNVGATPPALTITRNPTTGAISVTYGGVLQSAGTINGTFTDVPGATSPYAVSPTAAQLYLRSRN